MLYAAGAVHAMTKQQIAPPVLHEPRPARVRARQPARSRQGRAVRAVFALATRALRRLFLDEFVGDLDSRGDLTVDATVGLKRAEQLYDRVFLEYGDDSVAQLGGVHLACEQASNLLTKILEWGRLMAYLEQSTRYIPYDTTLSRAFPLLTARRTCSSSPTRSRAT